MSRCLRAHDVLRTPDENGQRWRVLSAYPLDGVIKLYDYQSRQEVYRCFTDISADVESGRVVLERMSAPAVSAVDSTVAIYQPSHGEYRSRKVVTRSRARPTGKFPSWKMERMIQWESVNELNAYRLLDADPNVLQYFEQPCLVKYRINGEIRKHYPDCLVVRSGGKELWEVKPNSEVIRPDVAERTTFLIRELPRLGFSYRLILGDDLAREPRLGNVLTILKYGRTPVSPIIRERLRQFTSQAGGLTWGDADSSVAGPLSRQAVCRLILEGDLKVDLDVSWTKNTILYWTSSVLTNRVRT